MVQETSDVTSLGDEPGYVLFFSYQLFNTFYYGIFRRISAMTTTFYCPRPPPMMSNSHFPHCQFHINESTTTGRLPGRRRVNLRAIHESRCAQSQTVFVGFNIWICFADALVFNNLKTLLIIYFPPVQSSCRTTS